MEALVPCGLESQIHSVNLPARPLPTHFTSEELQVKFFWNSDENSLSD